ncbi:tyrosine-type recombinase/integrase [Rhodopirellula baltica]|uniref:Integrase-recombinase protein n=1 Tax=Rhodopirellula baltica SWK14 TaxID=993516 RepID=L7CAI7_RHOBT|nr:site-specific integrase [Rhodopirellula baltica]ELP30840.1 integrase-recombinase protein [Rhodopirellula baltica SWK14]
MATLFKKQYTKPIPDGAQIIARTVKGESKQFAQWTDRRGKKRTAELTANGKRIKAEATTWTAKYRDGEGNVCEVATGCRQKDAASAVLADLLKRAEHVKSNILSAEQDRIADHAAVPITEHIEAFLEYQRRKGTHPDRVQHYATKLNETAATCHFRTLRDLSVDRLEGWLGEQRTNKRDMGAAVYNGYRESWLAFGNWCIGKRVNGEQTHFNGEKRLLTNPFDGMAKLDEEAERRRRARALTDDELTRLLDAARRRPLEHAMTVYRGPNKGKLLAKVPDERRAKLIALGNERALIYKTAVLTGLRLNELRTLECRDLSLGDLGFIRLRHSNEKSRKGSTLPLRTDLVAELRDWIADKQPGDRVFVVPDGLLRIMDRDLKAAGIPKKDADGCVVHVHALRHSFASHLSKAGVAPRIAQAAMRHSNIRLTMGTYTDERLLDTAEAIETLSMFRSAAIPNESGDTDAETEPRKLAPMLAPNSVQDSKKSPFESLSGQSDDDAENDADTKKPRKTLGLTGFLGVGDTELESVTSTMSKQLFHLQKRENPANHGISAFPAFRILRQNFPFPT